MVHNTFWFKVMILIYLVKVKILLKTQTLS